MTGDYMRALLNTVDPNIPLRTVHGMRGKVSRAQGAVVAVHAGPHPHGRRQLPRSWKTSCPRWPRVMTGTRDA